MIPAPDRSGPPTPFWRSLGHAWDGLVDAVRDQRNMRIHVVAGILAGTFAAQVPMPAAERGLIVLCVALVIAAEALNTSLEALVDLASPHRTERARIAKDAAAGAVLALAAASVALFALVAAARWDALVAGWREHLPSAIGALFLGAAAWRLASRRRLGTPAFAALVGGVILVTLGLLLRADCAPCVAVPAALLAASGAAARPGARE
jgi:diacylglycerol kinase (ATP)